MAPTSNGNERITGESRSSLEEKQISVLKEEVFNSMKS